MPRRGRLLGKEEDFIITAPVSGLEERSFAEWVVRQPVRLCGMGLRSQEDACQPGFAGALLQAAPFMAKIPCLEQVMGGEHHWGEDADPAGRLAPLLASGSRAGRELSSAWHQMKQEAEEAGRFLGEEVEGPLAGDIRDIGQHLEGSLRQSLVENREKVRGKVLLRALEQHPTKSARPVWSWPERDKQSSSWLLCLPGSKTSFSAEEFTTAGAALLCLPPPCCVPKVGDPVSGRVRVCKWGDNVVNATMRGDGWRTRHDSMKLLIRDLHVKAGIPIVCEVFNLFADCIPQAELARIQRGRRRQAIVPDFKLRGGRGESDKLCELKFLSACVSRYPRDPRPRDNKRGVDRRADGLTEVYAKSAREVDWRHCGTPRPPVRRGGDALPPRQLGPVETRLNSFGKVTGWVFGAWGECSQEVHQMVQKVAQARVQQADTLPGHRGLFKSREAELASQVSSVRRQLSFTAVREQARLLLDRLQLLGDGAREAAARRDWALRQRREEEMERQAQLVCEQQGRLIRRSGLPMLD